MNDLLHTLQTGSANLWLFIPTCILLGALHGLEPGHSKTMMAAFIVAVRGTIGQAVLLGLSAAISHSFIIWVLAALAIHFGNQWNAESVEPYLQIGSAVFIYALAVWMYLRTRREVGEAHGHKHHHGHDHGHGDHEHEHGHHSHEHGHHSHDGVFILDTGHGKVELSIFEEGVPPVFRLHVAPGAVLPGAGDVKIETIRADGTRQSFEFVPKTGFLETLESIPEPHEFETVLTLAHGGHGHTCRADFREGAHGAHDVESQEYQDAHERAHAHDIEQRFAGRAVTTPQIILFGVTGGLMPCPAAFTVLLVCLQLKRAVLGFSMVAAFSFGLAITMVLTGAIAAWSVQHAEKKFRGFGEVMRRAPYVSCVLLVVLASYMAWHGWATL